jgi:hypothetical protein
VVARGVERASRVGRALGGGQLARVVQEGGAAQELLARAMEEEQEVVGAVVWVLLFLGGLGCVSASGVLSPGAPIAVVVAVAAADRSLRSPFRGTNAP